MSSTKVRNRPAANHDDEDAIEAWTVVAETRLPSPVVGPWEETVDEDLLVATNPVVAALRSRIARAWGGNLQPGAYFPADIEDSAPEISRAIDEGVIAWYDETQD